jgi:hypothetical protein
MSLKVPCDVKSPQTTFTTGNTRAGSRFYGDIVKTGALGDHIYNATIQHNSQGVTGFHTVRGTRETAWGACMLFMIFE